MKPIVTVINHFQQHDFCGNKKCYLLQPNISFIVIQIKQSEYRMKKVTALFLLLMMMLSSVQPVVAMHFAEMSCILFHCFRQPISTPAAIM